PAVRGPYDPGSPRASLQALITLWRFRRLIASLAWRHLTTKYKNSLFGLTWALLQPLMALAVYTLVFGVGLGLGKIQAQEGVTPYVLIVFSGLVPYQMFSEVLTQSPGLVRARATVLQGALFPVEVVPCAATLASLLHMVIAGLIC